MSAAVFNLTLICLAIGSVIAYENAYDLLERRNRRLREPRIFHPPILYTSQNRFFPDDRNPRSHFGSFGNGYDNLGNGIRPRPFAHHLTNGWRFERRPFRERPFDDFGFAEHSHWGNYPRDYVSHRSDEHYPVLRGNQPSAGSYGSGGWQLAGTERFAGENEGKKQRKTDEIYQRSREGVKMDSSRKEKSGEEVQTDQVGENKSSLRSNKVVKKGRTTKGFAVHHHKDETGNSTTFFDESSDFGGQSDLRDFADGFGLKKTIEQLVSKGDEKSFNESGGQAGNYGSGFLAGNQRLEKDFSSSGGHKGPGGIENDGPRRSYQFLNGDPFDYTETEVDSYY